MSDNLSVRATLKNGVERWQELEGFELSYEIRRKKSLLGYFKPKECRGVVDYNNDESFIASHLPPLNELPAITEKGWQKIGDPNKVAVTIKTTFLTVEKFDRIDKMSCVMKGWEEGGKINTL